MRNNVVLKASNSMSTHGAFKPQTESPQIPKTPNKIINNNETAPLETLNMPCKDHEHHWASYLGSEALKP